MAILIEITSEPIAERSGISKKTGAAYTMREQPAYIHTGNAYPARFLLSLGTTVPHAPGFYHLDAKSIAVGEYGELKFARQVHLTPEKPAAVKAA